MAARGTLVRLPACLLAPLVPLSPPLGQACLLAWYRPGHWARAALCPQDLAQGTVEAVVSSLSAFPNKRKWRFAQAPQRRLPKQQKMDSFCWNLRFCGSLGMRGHPEVHSSYGTKFQLIWWLPDPIRARFDVFQLIPGLLRAPIVRSATGPVAY